MKKLLLLVMLAVMGVTAIQAQAQIKFDKYVHNFGTFSEADAVQKCTFTFTNVGDKPLIINKTASSCGCTVPTYTKTPVQPGEKGTITVTYNGKGKFPDHFKKTVTVYTNGVPEMIRLYVEGTMKAAEDKE